LKTFSRCVIAAIALLALDVLAGSVETTRPERVGMSEQQLERLHSRLQQMVDDEASAGFQILVSRHGRVVMHRNYGVTDIESRTPVTDDTLYRIYSMTKPVVAVAMMVLYEEGKYSLQDPVAKYIPEFEGAKVFAGVDDAGEMILEDALRPPTIHDLLQHTAGLSYGIFSDTPVDKLYRESAIFDTDRPLKELIAELASMPLLFQPGTEYHYSLGVDVQGYLIEVLSGMDAETFVRKRVLEPLGMDETSAWVAPEKASLLTRVHTHDEAGQLVVYEDDPESKFQTSHALRKPIAFSGGAQLIATGDDYWRFAQMLLNGGELDGVRILSPTTVELMTSNRFPESIAGRRFAPGQGHGFNLVVVTDNTLIPYPISNGEFSHGGLATTFFWADPELDLVVVLLNQYLPWSNPPYIDLIHRMVRAAVIAE